MHTTFGTDRLRGICPRALLLGLFVLLFPALPTADGRVAAQEEGEKKPLPIEDYGLWRSIRSVSISDDGRWATYGYQQREVDDTLFVKDLDGGAVQVIARASSPDFSDDSRWVAYYVSPPAEEVEKLEEAGDRVPRKAELRDLETGETWSWNDVASFRFSGGSRALAVEKRASDGDAEHEGTDLIVRYLEPGFEELLGSVADFAFNEGGTHLAYTVDAPDRDGNGVYLLELDTRVREPLDNARADYARLTWDEEEGSALAVLRGDDVEDRVEKENVLLAFRGVGGEEIERLVFDPADADGFPHGMVVSEKGSLEWSPDLSKVFLGVRRQQVAPEELCPEDAEEEGTGETAHEDPVLSDPLICGEVPVANVDIWHWDDERIQSVQENQASRDRNRTLLSVVHLDAGRFVQLADEEMREVDVTRDGRWGIGEDRTDYVSDWKPPYADYYRVDTGTGERTLVMERHETTLGLSPDSRNFLYWKDGHVWNYRIPDDEHTKLTSSAPVSFVDAEDDHTGETPPYGVEGWTEEGKAVILRHRYDLYVQPLDGSPAWNLTKGVGAGNEIRFRHVRTDPEARTVDLDEPLLLSAYGQWTKEDGFYRLDDGELEELVYEDAAFSFPLKADDADRLLLARQTFETFPDYHVTDLSFGKMERLTDANPQQDEYLWGRRILFDYTNDDGVRLQGTLAIPEGYEEGEKLPMLVHFYEKLSQNLHDYPDPRYASSPNYAGYVSNGYLVMEPDVHFRTRTSHSDMLESVEAAVERVVELGYADPGAVGLHGHSYSGGGASYIATRSDMFAAIVAGAAPINLRSEFNQIWPGSGSNNHRYDIYGQGRYGTDPFTDLELYLDQSPVTHAPTMDTPLLYLHGVEDAIVPWQQGLEFYNALRFHEKPVIWLSYPGEGHGLRRYENQVDFQTRMRQFFDHHLKGEPAPRWMTEGRSYLEKERARATNEGGG